MDELNQRNEHAKLQSVKPTGHLILQIDFMRMCAHRGKAVWKKQIIDCGNATVKEFTTVDTVCQLSRNPEGLWYGQRPCNVTDNVHSIRHGALLLEIDHPTYQIHFQIVSFVAFWNSFVTFLYQF